MQPNSNVYVIQDFQLSDISAYAKEYKLITSVTDAHIDLTQNISLASVNAIKDTLSSVLNVFQMSKTEGIHQASVELELSSILNKENVYLALMDVYHVLTVTVADNAVQISTSMQSPNSVLRNVVTERGMSCSAMMVTTMMETDVTGTAKLNLVTYAEGDLQTVSMFVFHSLLIESHSSWLDKSGTPQK